MLFSAAIGVAAGRLIGTKRGQALKFSGYITVESPWGTAKVNQVLGDAPFKPVACDPPVQSRGPVNNNKNRISQLMVS